MIGGALRARQVLAAYPDTRLGGPDDAAGDGRWIPTVSMEAYVGAVVRWFGVAAADMSDVLPAWPAWSGGGRGPLPLFR